MPAKQKLELTWIGKDVRQELEPRILLEDPPSFGNSGEASPGRSYHAKHRVGGKDFSTTVIYGDNLLALKALEHELTGKIKCIYIDPRTTRGVRSLTTTTASSIRCGFP